MGSNGQNHILAQPPLKFLPVKEFEKRQKSLKPEDWVPREMIAPPKPEDWIPKALVAPAKPSKPAPKPKNGKKKNKKRAK